MKKRKDFNPLERFRSWNRKKHNRFNWIAGSYMTKLGYDLEEIDSNQKLYVIRNILLDYIWCIRENFLGIARRIAYGAAKKLGLTKHSN